MPNCRRRSPRVERSRFNLAAIASSVSVPRSRSSASVHGRRKGSNLAICSLVRLASTAPTLRPSCLATSSSDAVPSSFNSFFVQSGAISTLSGPTMPRSRLCILTAISVRSNRRATSATGNSSSSAISSEVQRRNCSERRNTQICPLGLNGAKASRQFFCQDVVRSSPHQALFANRPFLWLIRKWEDAKLAASVAHRAEGPIHLQPYLFVGPFAQQCILSLSPGSAAKMNYALSFPSLLNRNNASSQLLGHVRIVLRVGYSEMLLSTLDLCELTFGNDPPGPMVINVPSSLPQFPSVERDSLFVRQS
jgi:hypothetical protein